MPRSIGNFSPLFPEPLSTILAQFDRSVASFRGALLLAFLSAWAGGCASADAVVGTPAHDYWSPTELRMEDHVYSPTIHTVQLFKKGFELAPPIIDLNGEDVLVLRFDDLQPNVENLTYTVVHCDANWQPSDLINGQYLSGAMNDYVPAGRLSYNTLQPFIQYEVEVPNGMMRITRSGNYLLKVYRDSDASDLVLTRRFMVFEQEVRIDARVMASRNVELRDVAQQVDITLRHDRLPVQDPFADIHITVLQNMRWDDARTGFRPRFVRGTELVYDFPEQGLFMGNNEYRNFDLKDLRFITPRVARITPGLGEGVYEAWLLPEVKRNIRVYFDQPDINGRFLVRNDLVDGDPLGADYARVHFSLPMSAPLMDPVHVYGGFSDFRCRKEYRMVWSEENKAYEATALLKQGFYDFTYVTLPAGATVPDLAAIEGSHFQTENDYVVLVYFTDRQQRCDRLVGVRFLNSRRG
ncbi:MAG: DUF5103 domain-containing protein [Flavobacteriales bacterium]|nr:DUF5103 domain-containing protein [Flavobacteriales bacterium]